VAVAFGLYTVIATAVGIAQRLPYQFGGAGDPDSVTQDALVHGTGISAPLIFVTVIILLAYIATRSRRASIPAAALVGLLSVVGIAAGLMEPALRALDPLITPVAVLGLAIAVLLLATALRVPLALLREPEGREPEHSKTRG
jgi:hypothetical protein